MYLSNSQLFYVTFVLLRYHLTCGLRYNIGAVSNWSENLEKATALNYSGPIPPANMECSTMKEEWQRWIDSFEMFSTAYKLDNEDDEVQRATLLHLAGPAAQTVLSNLKGDKTSTKSVKVHLTEFFAPKGNKCAERYRFNCRVQQPHESTDKFVSDLRKLGSTCSFADLDEQIISQIFE